MHTEWSTRSRRTSRSLLERIAEELIDEPDSPDERRFHDDLRRDEYDGGLSDERLAVERQRLRLAILVSERPSEWAVERLGLIEAELEARRGR